MQSQLAENRWRLVERLVALTRYRREWNAAAYARARDARVPELAEDAGMISWFLAGVGRRSDPTTSAEADAGEAALSP